MEPVLEDIANDILEGQTENRVGPLKVKTFKVIGSKVYDGLKGNWKEIDAQHVIEQQINDFLATVDDFWVENVDIHVAKNFLPHTATGEYEEVWYGTVVYHE